MRRAVIVGGGISGLSAAYDLTRASLPCTLIEREERLGGVIVTETVAGCLVEGGPDSFLSAKPWAMELIAELGLADEVIGSNDHLRRTYILRRGRLVPLPEGLLMMIPTRIGPLLGTRLLGWRTKLRMGLELLRRPEAAPRADRSVAEMIEDHYGRETLDYLAEPLLAGIYGGAPEELSAPSVLARFVEMETRHGSLTRGVLRERRAASDDGKMPLFRTLRGGMGRLVEALESAIRPAAEIRRGTAEALEAGGQGFRVRVDGEWLEAAQVVLACPAWRAAALARGIDGELAGLLESIPYTSSMTVALGYGRREIGHPLDGFGFLVPRRERKRLVATTWVGTKFDHRAPAGHALLRCFLGGAGQEAVIEEDDGKVVDAVREELRGILGLSAAPLFTRVRRWRRSMAQYTVGHAGRVEAIEARLRDLPGLHLAGNACHGIGVPDCIRSGRLAASRARLLMAN